MFEEKENKIFEENVRNCFRKNFTKKMVVIISQSWMFTNRHVWLQPILVLVIFSGQNLSWLSINDHDHHGHKIRCQRWSKEGARHVVVAFMT